MKEKNSKPCKGIIIDLHDRLYSLDNMEMEAMELQRRLYNIACLCMLMCSQIDLGLFGNPSYKELKNKNQCYQSQSSKEEIKDIHNI